MKVRLMLANSAEVRENLLFAMGIGWTMIGPTPSSFAIAALIEVDWDETNRPLRLAFEIFDVDGQPFNVATPTGDRPFQLGAQLSIGRPADAPPGTKFLAPVAINIQPVQFQPGRQYFLRASIDGATMDEAHFKVRLEPIVPQRR